MSLENKEAYRSDIEKHVSINVCKKSLNFLEMSDQKRVWPVLVALFLLAYQAPCLLTNIGTERKTFGA